MSESAKIDFHQKGDEQAVMSLTIHNAAGELHRSPEKLRALMEMLDLPAGTTARVTVMVSSTVVR